jgi:hypothetical protein
MDNCTLPFHLPVFACKQSKPRGRGIQCYIQWVLRRISLGLKRPNRDAAYSQPRLKASEKTPPFPERLYGVGTYSPPTRRHIPEYSNCHTAATNSNFRQRSVAHVIEEDSLDDQTSGGEIGLLVPDHIV